MLSLHALFLSTVSYSEVRYPGCPDAQSNEYRIREVYDGYRGGLPNRLRLGIKPDDPYDPQSVSDAAIDLRILVRTAAKRTMRQSNVVSLGFVSWNCENVDKFNKQLDIVFHPVEITVPSSAGMVSFDSRPAPTIPINPDLRVKLAELLHPSLLVDYSPATRFSAGARFSTMIRNPFSSQGGEIQITGSGLKSTSTAYYTTALDLRVAPGGDTVSIVPAVRIEASESPFFSQRFRTLAAHIGPVFERRLLNNFFSWMQIGGGLRVSNNRLTQDRNEHPAAIQNEIAGEWHFAADSFAGGGFTRVGFWTDVGKALDCKMSLVGMTPQSSMCTPSAPITRFQRYAFAAHHSRTFRSTDIEIIGGGGTSSGDWPLFRDYVGGYQYDFPLFESREGLSMSSVPYGAFLRSHGTRQNGPIADSYLHANLTIGLHVPKLEKPIVGCAAHKNCADESAEALGTLENLLMENYLIKGEDPESARRHVLRDTREVEPIISYLLARGSRFSVRPVIMLDVARLTGDEFPVPVYDLAAGPGLRISWPGARLEAGYMYSSGYRTLGSLIVRLRLDSLRKVPRFQGR